MVGSLAPLHDLCDFFLVLEVGDVFLPELAAGDDLDGLLGADEAHLLFESFDFWEVVDLEELSEECEGLLEGLVFVWLYEVVIDGFGVAESEFGEVLEEEVIFCL